MVGFAACRSDCVRVRCDRGVQERPCEGAVRPRQPCASVPPSHFENFRQAWQKCVAKFGNARPRPKQDKYVRTRSTSVKKERSGFPSRDLINTNPCFMRQLMHIFFSKDQRANHLTPHRLINAAPCKPTFKQGVWFQGLFYVGTRKSPRTREPNTTLMSLVASTRQTPSILPQLLLVAFCKL